MKFEIKNRWNGSVQFECELSAEIAGKSYALQLGFAVKKALESGADLRGADLSGADLRGADLSGANWMPKISNIHKTVYAAASPEGALNMGSWHCGTSHCRAGWVVTLAGEGGKVLEGVYGTATAAALIYQASDPALEKIPDFYCSDDAALADMKRLAEANP